jgi:hypothetical protein
MKTLKDLIEEHVKIIKFVTKDDLADDVVKDMATLIATITAKQMAKEITNIHEYNFKPIEGLSNRIYIDKHELQENINEFLNETS